MNWLGIHLSLLLGETIPRPAPLFVAEALQSVEISHNDQGPSGFQITFHVGRSSIVDLMDYRLLMNPLIKPFCRVIITVSFATTPEVLMDGIITNHQLNPSNEPGSSTLTVTGEDISVLMDLEEVSRPYPNQSDYDIVTTIINNYRRYGLDLSSEPPAAVPSYPNPQERTPHQPTGVTDRGYIQQLASRHGYVFYVTPGPAPQRNVAYWGPPKRSDIPQHALSVNVGPETNVESINFRYNALAPHTVTFGDSDSISSSNRTPLVTHQAELRRSQHITDTSKLQNTEDTLLRERAQAMVNQSLDEVVTATGSLDALRYNGLLKARSVVGLRGVGRSYDGSYYVKSVTHSIRKGEYKQNFTLTREGTGTLTSMVRP